MGNPNKYMAILDHMGRELSFLPPEMHSYPSPQGEGVIFLQSLSFPSFSPKCNATLRHKSSPIFMCTRILPPSKCKIHTKCFLTNSYFFVYLYLFIVFLFISLLLLFPLNLLFFLFFPQNLEFFPKVEKLLPSFWGE